MDYFSQAAGQQTPQGAGLNSPYFNGGEGPQEDTGTGLSSIMDILFLLSMFGSGKGAGKMLGKMKGMGKKALNMGQKGLGAAKNMMKG
jgi:hypothetical protein